MEGGWKTIIGEEHKTITAGGKGVSGKRMEDFIIGEEHKTITAGGKGVSGKRSEDFIIGKEHTSKKAVEERETLLPGGSTKNLCRREWGWVCGRKCEDFVTGRWPRSRGRKARGTIHPPEHPLPSRSKGREANTENKIKTSKQSKHIVLCSRQKVKFVSHPLPAKI